MLKRLFICALIGGVVSICILVLTYWHVDSLVHSRLTIKKYSLAPGIYSRPFDVYSGKSIKSAILIDELHERGYKRVSNRPTKPGEYFELNGVFEIFVREAYHPAEGLLPHSLILYHSEKGLIENESLPGMQSFSLEPIMVSPLGTKDIRASNFQPLSAFSPATREMVLAAEDHRFYEHGGIDPVGIARAFFANIFAGRIVQGGSTLTQQLAKNLLFTPERSYTRKIKELLAAVSLESRFSKDEILEMYLNEVYLGQEGSVAIHGFPEAASAFFRKKLADLTIADAALLAGIIKAPSFYSPRNHPKRAIARREIVLSRALEINSISQQEFNSARKQPLHIAAEPRFKRNAPFFEVALINELKDYINTEAISRAGVRVYTGIDLAMQRCAHRAIEKSFELIHARKPATKKIAGGLEVGLVAIEPHSGLIRAWVGGKNYAQNQFDHVYQAERQIGSTIKPFVYLTALDKEANQYKTATASSIIRDAPFEVTQPGQPVWKPENYDKKYRGDVTLRYALENSINIPSVYVATRVGIKNVARTIAGFRLADQVPEVPSIALGALDTTLLDLTAGYAAMANGGLYTRPRMFLHALDQEDRVLASSVISEQRVGKETTTYVITNILQGVLDRGTGALIRREGFTGIAAGKTGTSNDTRDSWFIGYTPQLATGVWIGNDKNLSTTLTGASGAGVVWSHFMQCAGERLEDTPFLPPPGVVFADIDTATGKRVSRDCPGSTTVKEVYIEDNVPPFLCEKPYGIQPSNRTYNPQYKERKRSKQKSFWDLLWDTE